MTIEWLDSRLPPVRTIERRSEADYYGASDVIGAALGYAALPMSIASWKHGVSYERSMNAPELLLTEGNRASRHLVANEWQANTLRQGGYFRVHAVGVPFIYAEPSGADRLPNSLLVMPAHHVANATHSFDEAGYADRLQAIRGHFDTVVACVSATCAREGAWTRAFEKIGLPWIVGADSNDGNALRRMRQIFSMFEFMTTNTLGSHVAYAAYSGCRVSIWGPYAEVRLEDYRNVAWYRKNWSRAAELIACYAESRVRRDHPILFRQPWAAEDLREWAEPFVGHAHRRQPSEIAQLLGWTPIGQAEARMHRAVKRFANLGRGVMQRIGVGSPS